MIDTGVVPAVHLTPAGVSLTTHPGQTRVNRSLHDNAMALRDDGGSKRVLLGNLWPSVAYPAHSAKRLICNFVWASLHHCIWVTYAHLTCQRVARRAPSNIAAKAKYSYSRAAGGTNDQTSRDIVIGIYAGDFSWPRGGGRLAPAPNLPSKVGALRIRD